MSKKELKEEIRRLAREKNAVIMAHYYVDGEVQDLADFIGDSLALAQQAAKTDADLIVLCGVHFMGETAAILCPDKKVLVPDPAATCSLAESCPADEFAAFVAAHPGHTVISYVNTTAATKAVTDIVVTSSNARKIVESLPTCHVHARFSVEKILELKREHPQAKVLVHPECKGAVVKLADQVGSTAALLKYALENKATEFIVATESGILHEMQKKAPQKTFIPAPPEEAMVETPEGKQSCACNECEYMKMVTLEKVYRCLRDEQPVVKVDKEIAEKAIKPIERMLALSR